MQTPKMWSNILYMVGPANDAQAKSLTKLGRMGCIMSQVGFPGSQVDTEFFIKFSESAWNKMETKNVMPNELYKTQLIFKESARTYLLMYYYLI